MNHAFELAQQAIQQLRPELLLMAGKAAEGAATESGKQLISWFRDHLKSPPAQTALTEAETHPDNDWRIAALQLQIEILLDENESFRAALEKLLKDLPASTRSHQSVSCVGDNNKIAQAAGQGNKINIG